MSNRTPQRPRKPPVPRSGEQPQDNTRQWELVDSVLLPGLELLATEIRRDPRFHVEATRRTGHGPGAQIVVTLADGRHRDAVFLCQVFLHDGRHGLETHARIVPSLEDGRYSRKTRKVDDLLFGPFGRESRISESTTPVQVRDRIRKEYEQNRSDLGDSWY